MLTFTIFKGSASIRVVESTITKTDLVGNQVYIRIAASDLCGTDMN
jgi:hypothetical protein